jgi:hypothetical protein
MVPATAGRPGFTRGMARSLFRFAVYSADNAIIAGSERRGFLPAVIIIC